MSPKAQTDPLPNYPKAGQKLSDAVERKAGGSLGDGRLQQQSVVCAMPHSCERPPAIEHSVGSEFEVDLHGVNERQEPGEELLVDGVSVVGVVGSAVGELHDAAELIVLAAG